MATPQVGWTDKTDGAGSGTTGQMTADDFNEVKTSCNGAATRIDAIVALTGRPETSTGLGTFSQSPTVVSSGDTVETAIQTLASAISALTTLVGRPLNSTHMGTFTGSTLDDSADLATILQTVEDELDGYTEPLYAAATVSAAGTRGSMPAAAAGQDIFVVTGAGTYRLPSAITVHSLVDFTTSEPGSPSTSTLYYNTETGTSSGTSQAVVAERVYRWNGTIWTEYALTSRVTLILDASTDHLYVYTGSDLIAQIPSTYVGATMTAAGTAGNLPAATAGRIDHRLSGDGTWRLPDVVSVLNVIDMTSAEPGSPGSGDWYYNTTTGTSSGTSQAVTANRLYRWNGTTWTEYSIAEPQLIWDETANLLKVWNGSTLSTGSAL